MGEPELKEFERQYHDAAKAWMAGDPTPWAGLCSRGPTVTIFEAWGGSAQGWDAVGGEYEARARDNAGGTIAFEPLARHTGAGLAVLVDRVRGQIRIRGVANAVPFDVRVTTVFGVENGQWKLLHRHADPMAGALNPAASE
jgi:SnoaL-like domain